MPVAKVLIANTSKKYRVDNDTCLGFDFGIKKIGIAVGSLETAIANPLRTLRAVQQKPDWQNISSLITEWKPGQLVVGISHQQNGSDNPVTPVIKRFCRQLEGRYGLPVHQLDEQLTTFEAKQLLFDDLKTNAKDLWQIQDQLAAQLILQTWLNDKRQRERLND